MTPDERQEMNRLCQIIQTEKSHAEFMKALHQRLNLIGEKERRIDPSAAEPQKK